MAINYTPLLSLAEPVTGTQSGTWGNDINQGLTDYLDIAIAGAQVISGSQTAVTLSQTTGSALASNITQVGSAGTTGTAQYAVINCTGNPVSMLTITAPATSKTYVVINSTSTNQSVKLVGPGPTTGVTVAAAQAALIAWKGSDFALIATTDASKLTGTLGIANGGTGQTTQQAALNALVGTQTANRVLRSDGTNSTLAQVALATDVTGTLPTANGGTGLTTYTSGGVLFADSTSSLTTNSSITYSNDRTLRVGATGYIDGWNTSYKTFTIGAQTLAGVSGGTVGHLTSNLCDTTGAGVWNYAISAGLNRGSVLTQFNGILTWSATVSTGAGGTFATITQRISADFNGNVQFNTAGSPGAFVQYGTASITKKLTSGVASVASGATITPTSDDGNQYNVTALATSAAIAAPSGTPVDGQKLIIRLRDNNTAQGLTWNAIYRTIGTTLPSTTVATKTTYVGCIYNSADAVWDVVAVTTQA